MDGLSYSVPDLGSKQLQIYQTRKAMSIWRKDDGLGKKMPLKMHTITNKVEQTYNHFPDTGWGLERDILFKCM